MCRAWITDGRFRLVLNPPLPGEFEARVLSHVESSVLSYRSLGQDYISLKLLWTTRGVAVTCGTALKNQKIVGDGDMMSFYGSGRRRRQQYCTVGERSTTC